MSVLKNRILVFFILGLTVFCGCRILPWWGEFGNSADDDYIPGKIILSRNLATTEELDLDTAEFKLKIAANSLKSDAMIIITQIDPTISGLSWPDEFKPVGNIYNIRLTPEQVTLRLPATLTMAIPMRHADSRYFVMRRSTDGKLTLHSEVGSDSSGFIQITTMQFSSWVIVEQQLPIAGELIDAPLLTIAPSLSVTPKAGVFTQDVSVNVLLHGKNASARGNGSLSLEFTSFAQFSLPIAYSDSENKSLTLESNSSYQSSIDLFNPAMAYKTSSGNLATFTSKLRLTGKNAEELPSFIAMRAIYTLKNGISYNGYGAVYLEKSPTAAPPALTSVIPVHQSSGVSPETDVILQFNVPIAKSSFIQAISINPVANIVTESISWSEDSSLVRFSFDSALATDTQYTLHLGTQLEDAYGNKLTQPITSRFTTGDGLAPTVIGFAPALADQPHPTNGSVKITFSKPIASGTAIITFTPAPANNAIFSWGTDEVEIAPDPAWADDSLIEINIAPGLADMAGKRTGTPINLSFTTGSLVAAEITQFLPADQSPEVKVNAKVSLTFDMPMKTGETESAIVLSDSFPATRIFSWNTDKTSLEITFLPRLSLGTEHTVTIKSSAQSQTGTSLARQYSSTFFTEPGIEPMVSAVVPQDNATNVSIKSAISITFNTDMNKTSVENALSITDESNTPVAGAFTWANDTLAVFTPAIVLSHSKSYRIQLSTDARNAKELQLLTPLDINFATTANPPATLLSAVPANGAMNVPSSQVVSMAFSEAIAEDSFVIEITPDLPGGYSAVWAADHKQVNLTFTSGFASNTQYKLKVKPETTDISGQPVDEIAELAFTSEIFDAPRAIAFSPISGNKSVAVNSKFVISFDSSMDPVSTNAAISFIPTLISGMAFAWSDNNKRVEITPSAPLAFNTNYRLLIAQTAQRSDGQTMLTSYQLLYKTALQTFVSANSPVDSASSVSVHTPIEIIFSEEINLLSLQTNLRVTSSGTPITGATTLTDKTARWVAATSLPFGAIITVEVKNGVLDKNGAAVAVKSFSFTTEAEDITVPEVISTLPVPGAVDVPLNQQLTISFNKPMNQASVAGALSINPLPAGSIATSWVESGKTIIISYSEPLDHNTSYQLKLSTAAKDLANKPLAANFLLAWRTIARPEITINQCYPLPAATGVALSPQIKVKFTKAMNKESVVSAFRLQQGSNNVPGTFSWPSAEQMIFVPASDLANNMAYTVSINTSARDTNDNYLESLQSWSFTTTSAEGKIWRLDRAQLADSGNVVFTPRQDHVMITFNNKLWVIGGFDGEYLNDVWSSNNGAAWSKNSSAAPFKPRAGHACVIFANKIWLTGGFSDEDGFFDDVWSSTNGTNWVLEKAEAAYYKRAWHSMQVFANRLWILAGESFEDATSSNVLLDDSWSSTDGKDWIQRSTITAFFPRKKIMSGVINDKLWVWGGYGENATFQKGVLNDIWSTANGEYWSLVSANAPFAARCGAAGTLFNNRMWLAGGATAENDGPFLNDIWASSDGTNWVAILPGSTGSAQHFAPRGFSQTSSLGGRIYLSGGENTAGLLNEVWSSQ